MLGLFRVFAASLLAAMLTGSPAFAAPEPAGELPADIKYFIRGLESNLVYMGNSFADEYIPAHRQFYIRLEPVGVSIDPEAIPLGRVISIAAQNYAAQTKSYSFTLGELYHAGWLPYYLPQWEPYWETYIANSEAQPLLDEHFDITPYIGSPSWVVKQKMSVAGWFYNNAYPSSYSGLAKYGDVERVRLRERPISNAAFWINPYTGQPAVEGNAAGDLNLMDYAKSMQGARKSEYPEWLKNVPQFNYSARPSKN